jgi:ATP-binding cassette subfamily B protein
MLWLNELPSSFPTESPPSNLIVVMKDGEIVERGTHEVLLNRNGVYAGIYEKQLLQEELDTL